VRFGSSGMDYLDSSSLSVEEFDEKYAAAGRPCMVRGVTAHWRAADRWKSPQDFAKWYGDVAIRVTERKEDPASLPQPLRLPIAKYIAYAQADSGGADFPYYGFDDDLSGARQVLARDADWHVPSFCSQDCYDMSAQARHVFPRNTFFILGGARTGTNLHVDPNCTSAWNTLLCGRKRWLLFPPLRHEGLAEMHVPRDASKAKHTPPCWWWGEVYPKIVSSGAALRHGVIECIQEAGDTIFVPEGWWHTVLNLDLTIAITANPLLPATLHRVWPRLDWPAHFLRELACRCANKWPSLRMPQAIQEGAGGGGGGGVTLWGGGESHFLKSLEEGEAEGGEGEGGGGSLCEAALARWLGAFSLLALLAIY